jgi:hypothetical protein
MSGLLFRLHLLISIPYLHDLFILILISSIIIIIIIIMSASAVHAEVVLLLDTLDESLINSD